MDTPRNPTPQVDNIHFTQRASVKKNTKDKTDKRLLVPTSKPQGDGGPVDMDAEESQATPATRDRGAEERAKNTTAAVAKRKRSAEQRASTRTELRRRRLE